MPGRGNHRGRGGGGRGGGGGGGYNKPKLDSVPMRDRLGKIPIYPKQNNLNIRGTNNKYKLVNRQSTVTSCITKLPDEIKIRNLSKKFLKSYYEVFDRPGRINLESKYSADAFLSFSATYAMPTFGRNLLQIHEPNDRNSLLVHNKTNIISALNHFPPTEHLVNFMSSDVPFYIINPMYVTSMQIVVTGVFKDTSAQTDPLRAFTRVFVLKQSSVDKEGEPVYEIFNDLFMVQPPTPDQIKKYHNDAQLNRTFSSSQQARPNASTTAGDMSLKSENEKLKSIMAKTRMNIEGSRKLLQDCNWDEKHSIEVFNALQAANKIPQEFFTP